MSAQRLPAGRDEVLAGLADTLDLTPILGANLRRLRARRGLSLERLARASGVSRAMLGQIELGQSTPTMVPLAQLRASPKQALPRDGIIFVCAAGVRSQSAARLALESGLRTVYNLSGGTKNWVRAGLSLVQD